MSGPGEAIWMLKGRDQEGREIRIAISEAVLKAGGEQRIGRASHVEQVLRADSIARTHAAIYWGEHGPRIVRHTAPSPVMVNETDIELGHSAAVAEGDRVTLGEIALTVSRSGGG